MGSLHFYNKDTLGKWLVRYFNNPNDRPCWGTNGDMIRFIVKKLKE